MAKTEVLYTKAKLLKRIGAHFIDIGLTFLTALTLYSIINTIITHSGWFKSKENEMVEIKNESGLYVNGVVVTSYVDNADLYPSYLQRKNELSSRIDAFYVNPTYFNDNKALLNYNGRKLNATTTVDGNTIHLFIVEADVIKENAVSDEALFNFYKDEIDDNALGYLVNNPTYFALTKFSFWVSVVEIIVLATISFALYYLLFPLAVFRRGRQTLGMKLEKIGLITVKAENLSAGVYVGRFFFMYFVFLPLNFVSFLIPTFVSLGMMYFTKSNSSLVNYVFNDYMVDVTDQKIYFNALEREEFEIKLQEISIENKDLRLK